jgi:hypothetical protein
MESALLAPQICSSGIPRKLSTYQYILASYSRLFKGILVPTSSA